MPFQKGHKLGFHSENQPIKNGRPKGRRNTKTIINEFLNSEAPESILKKFKKFTNKTRIDELMIVNLIIRSLGGDMRAQRIFSQLSGDMTEEQQSNQTNVLNIFNTLPIKIQNNIKKTYNSKNPTIDVTGK